MSKYNTKTQPKTLTHNLAGGQAYKESVKLELVSLLLTSFMRDQFYRSESKSLAKLKDIVDQITDKQFVAKSALYARTVFGMRSITHAVAGELAKQVKDQAWTKKFYTKVISRPDDITETLAYYLKNYGKPLPNALKRGLAGALEGFNDYQLAKYKGEGKTLSMIDAVNLVHPRATDALTKLMKGTLEPAETWETKLTVIGQSDGTEGEKTALKKEAWEQLIKEKKLGYFALVRNLRNILEQSPKILPEALAMLCDQKLIKKSMVLPFRYTTAIDQISELNGVGVRKVLVALNKALDLSTANVPKFTGDTLVVLDRSGSMEGKTLKIGALFATILVKANNADLMVFSDDARYKTINPSDSTGSIAKSLSRTDGGTNFHAIFQTANRAYDRIIILSDMQGWMGYDSPVKDFNDYCQRCGARPKIYSWDLAGYGSLQFPEPSVTCLAGFSEKAFDLIKLLEKDRTALLDEIQKIDL